MKIELYILQLEHGGIPEKPEVFTALFQTGLFLRRLSEMIIQQGFRQIREDETLGEYYEAYLDELDDPDSITYPNLDPDNTVRYWTEEIRISLQLI